ncbi:hypothetical protein BH23CHL2_BH23CHL2_22660 [soil metagenome]
MSHRTNVIWEALAWTGHEHLCLEAGDDGYAIDELDLVTDYPSLFRRVWPETDTTAESC